MKEKLFIYLSNFIYSAASIALLIISMTMIGYAMNIVYDAFQSGGKILDTLLDGISIIVISVAGFDVSKYLMEEEVLRERELRSPAEARRTLTKFMVIIIIAVSLESLVFIFGAGKEDVTTLVYPSLLLGLIVFLLIGLGVYQKLSISVESEQSAASLDTS